MKRYICLLLVFLIVLSFAACVKEPVQEPSGNTTQSNIPQDTTLHPDSTQDTTDTAVHAVQLPMCAVFMPLVTEEVTASDGTVVFRTTYQDISLTLQNTDCADSIILDLLRRIDLSNKSDLELLNWAISDYTGQEGWIPYFSEILYSPVRMDEKVLSFYGSHMSYGGGVHPNINCTSVSYDLASGRSLTMADILVDQAAADTLCDMIIEKLVSIDEEYSLYPGYERTVNERYGTVFDTTWEPTDAWFLSDAGLGIYFSPYDLAPYAMGAIELVFSYDDLGGILKEDFFPASLPESVPGTVEAILAQDIDLDNFSQFGEAILEEDGEHVVLYTNGLVENLTLELGQWDSDGISFFPTATVFAADTLTPGDAVLLYTMFADVMPHLRLRYTSGGTEYRFFLTQSGKDGSIILLEDLT